MNYPLVGVDTMLQRVVAIILLWLAVNVQLVAAIGHQCNITDPATLYQDQALNTHQQHTSAGMPEDNAGTDCCLQGDCNSSCSGSHCHLAAALLPTPLQTPASLPEGISITFRMQLLSPVARLEQPPIIL